MPDADNVQIRKKIYTECFLKMSRKIAGGILKILCNICKRNIFLIVFFDIISIASRPAGKQKGGRDYPAAGISIGAAPAYQITTRSSSGMNISPSVILNAS